MKKIVIALVVAAILGTAGYLYLSGRSGDEPQAEAPSAPSMAPDAIVVNVNSDPESNIAMVAVSERGEGAVVFTESEDGMDYVSQVVIVDGNRETGLIEVGRDGLPTTLTMKGHTITYSNFTESTVDLLVAKDNGVVMRHENVPLSLPEETSVDSLSLIPAAHAAGAPGVKPIPTEKKMNEGSSYWPHTFGQIANLTLCSLGVVASFGTAGVTAPLLVSCGTLVTRAVTGVTGYSNCAGDIIQCSTDTLANEIQAAVQKYGPDWLANGFRLKGRVVNSVTATPITNGVISTQLWKSRQDGPRGEWYADGTFDLYFARTGEYMARFSSEGYAEAPIEINVFEKSAELYVPGSEQGIEITFAKGWLFDHTYGEHEMNYAIPPDAYVRGTVVDDETRLPLEDVQVALLDGTEEVDAGVTDDEGEFVLQPPITVVGPKSFTVLATAEGYAPVREEVPVSYEVKPMSNDYDTGDWDRLIVMRPGVEVWEIGVTGDLTSRCGWTLDTFHIAERNGQLNLMNFGEDCTDPKGCVAWPLEGKLTAPGPVEFSTTSLFGGKIATYTGTLGAEDGRGTWHKPIPEGVSSGERHHYTECQGEWTAKKLIK